MEEIERRGYDIVCISGCSIGAMVARIYSPGKLDDYRNWIESLDYLDVLRLVDASFRLRPIRGEKSSDKSVRLLAKSTSKICASPTRRW